MNKESVLLLKIYGHQVITNVPGTLPEPAMVAPAPEEPDGAEVGMARSTVRDDGQ